MGEYKKSATNITIDRYLEGYLDNVGLDIEPEELESYPRRTLEEDEFWDVKHELDAEIDSLLEGEND